MLKAWQRIEILEEIVSFGAKFYYFVGASGLNWKPTATHGECPK
jgi:hypothetical protein